MAEVTGSMRDLPETIREIAEVIGREQALYLIGRLPPAGSRPWRICFYVPKAIKPDHQLIRILGYHDAMRMVRAFGGEILQTSNGRFIERRFRNLVIWHLSVNGMTAPEISQEIITPYELVKKILQGNPPEGMPRRIAHDRAAS